MSRQLIKFPYVSPEMLAYEHEIISKSLTGFALINRASTIQKSLLSLFLEIYNGVRFYMILISNDTVGQLVGEFSPTRKKPISPVKAQKLKKKKGK